MVQRRRTAKVVQMPEAPDPWRLKWIEADIKALKEQAIPDLRKLIDAHTDQLTKINRNLLIMGFAIMGLGVASKVFSGPIADLVKNILGI
jgi:hypothetical protein